MKTLGFGPGTIPSLLDFGLGLKWRAMPAGTNDIFALLRRTGFAMEATNETYEACRFFEGNKEKSSSFDNELAARAKINQWKARKPPIGELEYKIKVYGLIDGKLQTIKIIHCNG